MNPLERLRRKDKWFLGGGTGSIYAPVFPKWLTTIGFWDECLFADIRLNRLFTALLLHGNRPVRFQSRTLDWRPDRLLLEHISDGVKLLETRTVLPSHTWVSRLDILKAPSGPLDMVLWSLQDFDPLAGGAPRRSIVSAEPRRGFLQFGFDTAWPKELEADRTAVESEMVTAGAGMGEPLRVFLTLGTDKVLQNRFVQHAQRHDDSPLYETSVLPGILPHVFEGSGLLAEDKEIGLVHLGLTYRVQQGESIILAAAAGLTEEISQSNLEEALAQDPIQASEKSWRTYFSGVPQFSSSDPFLTNAYWYRWYGLRLNTVSIPNLPIAGTSQSFEPFVTEGVGFFRNFITYSAQAHIRETSWMHDPTLAVGIVENLARIQRQDGSFPGHNYSSRPSRDFYHADFAAGYDQLEALHGARASKSVAEALAHSLQYFATHRWAKDKSGFLIFDQNETGQEYMNRYLFGNPQADNWEQFRIVGVDATVYVLRLAKLVRGLGLRHRRQDWIELADKVTLETKPVAYDASAAFLCDRLESGKVSPARPATGFYGLTERGMGHAIEQEREIVDRWLAKPGSFRAKRGFFAESHDEPTFNPDGVWKGKRLNCPWNGRSWPMVNSHLVDELAAFARHNPAYRNLAGECLMNCVRMMFHDNDASRPNSFEHYNPRTGEASLYRGYDDYMHSWIVDLILRHAVGYQTNTKTFDPLPLPDVEWIECRGIPDPHQPRQVRIEKSVVV